LSDFNKTNIFGYIVEIYSISSFMKIRPVGAELFCTDGHDKANSRFSQLWKCAKKVYKASWQV